MEYDLIITGAFLLAISLIWIHAFFAKWIIPYNFYGEKKAVSLDKFEKKLKNKFKKCDVTVKYIPSHDHVVFEIKNEKGSISETIGLFDFKIELRHYTIFKRIFMVKRAFKGRYATGFLHPTIDVYTDLKEEDNLIKLWIDAIYRNSEDFR